MAPRFIQNTKTRIAVIAGGLAIATVVGGGVAAANQPKVAPVAASSPRSCGASTSYSFSNISVWTQACLQLVDGGSPVAMEYSADVKITAPDNVVAYCEVKLEGTMKASGTPREARTLSCFDFVTSSTVPPPTKYTGGTDGRATTDGVSRVTVLIGTNKSTARIVTASHATVL